MRDLQSLLSLSWIAVIVPATGTFSNDSLCLWEQTLTVIQFPKALH